MIRVLKFGDPVACYCFPGTPGIIIIPAQWQVWVEGSILAVLGGKGNHCLFLYPIITGSSRVWCSGRPVAHDISIIVCGTGFATAFRTFVGL